MKKVVISICLSVLSMVRSKIKYNDPVFKNIARTVVKEQYDH